ncbi:MAG: hypothetical protein ACLFSQ_08695 [Candidatus Zixiibacteriota bacterium]
MKKLLFTILLMILGFSCWKETPPGNTAPPRDMQIYQDRLPQPADNFRHRGNYYESNDRSTTKSSTSNYQNLGCNILKHIKTGIFYNSDLNTRISSWHIEDKNVLEFTTKGNNEITKKVYTERYIPYTNQVEDIDEILSATIEERIMHILLQSEARIIDKALALRQTANELELTDLREAEISALREKIDLLIEVNFIPSQASEDGYEVRIKAMRTKDGAVLSYRTTTDIDQYTRVHYAFKPIDTGYDEIPIALEDLTEILMHDVIRDICMNW